MASPHGSVSTVSAKSPQSTLDDAAHSPRTPLPPIAEHDVTDATVKPTSQTSDVTVTGKQVLPERIPVSAASGLAPKPAPATLGARPPAAVLFSGAAATPAPQGTHIVVKKRASAAAPVQVKAGLDVFTFPGDKNNDADEDDCQIVGVEPAAAVALAVTSAPPSDAASKLQQRQQQARVAHAVIANTNRASQISSDVTSLPASRPCVVHVHA